MRDKLLRRVSNDCKYIETGQLLPEYAGGFDVVPAEQDAPNEGVEVYQRVAYSRYSSWLEIGQTSNYPCLCSAYLWAYRHIFVAASWLVFAAVEVSVVAFGPSFEGFEILREDELVSQRDSRDKKKTYEEDWRLERTKLTCELLLLMVHLMLGTKML